MLSRTSWHALGLGLLAAFFWGTHSVIVRYLASDMHGLTIAVARLYIAAFALYLVMRMGKQAVRIDLKDRLFLLTVAGSVANYVLFHIGLEYTTASNAMLLENTAPIFVIVVLVVVLRHRVRKVELAATALAVLGTFFAIRADLSLGGERLLGDVFEILAGATWAIFIVGSSLALAKTDKTLARIGFLFNVFLVSAIVLTPFVFLYPADHPTWEDIGLLVALGVFPTAVAYYLWYEAAARVSAVSASLLFTLSVVFTLVNAYLFLGEALSGNILIGAVLIVAGVLLSKAAPQDDAR